MAKKLFGINSKQLLRFFKFLQNQSAQMETSL